jgi:hypothetical protein
MQEEKERPEERKGLEKERRWRRVGAREWQALADGRRWRMAGVGGWQALENGRRWRMAVAGIPYILGCDFFQLRGLRPQFRRSLPRMAPYLGLRL